MNTLARTYGDYTIMLGMLVSKDNAYERLIDWSTKLMKDLSPSSCIALGQIERELMDIGYLSIEQIEEIEYKVNKFLEKEEMSLL